VTIETAPAFRVTTERTHLQRERGYAPAESLSELVLDTVLAKLAESLAPGRPAPTKNALADLVELAAKVAHEKAEATTRCACGHEGDDHIGWIGCLECDCCERRPHAAEAPPQPRVPRILPTAAEVARAYENDERHFPAGGGAR
jgi:hypothetical protein